MRSSQTRLDQVRYSSPQNGLYDPDKQSDKQSDLNKSPSIDATSFSHETNANKFWNGCNGVAMIDSKFERKTSSTIRFGKLLAKLVLCWLMNKHWTKALVFPMA